MGNGIFGRRMEDRSLIMSGYEELTAEQIMLLAKMVLSGVIVIMLSRVIPAILEYKSMRLLEVKIISKSCSESNDETSTYKKVLDWVQKRMRPKNSYNPYVPNNKELVRELK